MRRFTVVFVLLCGSAATAVPDKAPPPRPVVRPVVESSLPTGGRNIRQFAFDGDPATVFVSDRPAKKGDHLTLTFDKAVPLKSVAVLTGRPDGTDALTDGTLEVSRDGKSFTPIGTLAAGTVAADRLTSSVKALRVRATKDQPYPLVVREFTIESVPQVVAFRYPIEIALDVSDAPEMKAWGEKVVRVCEREYSDICTFLASDGYTPPTQLRMTLKTDYNGVAATYGDRIVGSVKYFKGQPDDVGAMIHETVHCVQQYKGQKTPGWLVEGIADYVRFWRYEPGKAGRLTPERARYDGSYRTTAAFLAFVTQRYDRQAVSKLNATCREGRYTPDVWRTLTGKSVEELNQEWRQSLAR